METYRKTCVLLLPGELFNPDKIAVSLPKDYIIAVDGGISQAVALRLQPDLWLGDFDSTCEQDRVIFSEVEQKVYSRDKDETDTELALLQVPNGTETIYVVGGLDGRMDHFMGLMCLTYAYAKHQFVFTNGRTQVISINPDHPYDADLQQETNFSLIGLGALEGLSISGAKWSLDSINVPFGCSRTLSNKALGGTLQVSLLSGHALLMINP